MKLNIGCGNDYRTGYVNIDIDPNLPKIDMVLDISKDNLVQHFPISSIDHILAQDIIEHLFHWQAVNLLHEFYKILKNSGTLTIQIPDFEVIISSNMSSEKKIQKLFGGQDISNSASKSNHLRKEHPEFFCHKYTWTKNSISTQLNDIGFTITQIQNIHTNLTIHAIKK